MKRLSLYLFLLLFTLQAPSQADDIRDFQIEGISIGDSLLDHFTEAEFKEASKEAEIRFHKDNKFAELLFYKHSKFEIYDGVRVVWKPKDENYQLYGVTGLIYFRYNFEDCSNKRKIIENEITTILKNSKKIDRGKVNHTFDKTGDSYFNEIYFKVDGLDQIRLYCMNWSDKFDKIGYWDALNVIIGGKEFGKFLIDEAYK